MDYAAERGYDAYFVDIRGTAFHPPGVHGCPPDQNPAFATPGCHKGCGAAVNFILKRRNVTKINLVGCPGARPSWQLTAQNNDKS